jgi:hypothetical protein
MKKTALRLLLALALVCLFSTAAFAADHPNLSLDSSADFTMVLDANETADHATTVVPYDQYWSPESFDPGDLANISWVSDNDNVAIFDENDSDSYSGSDSATIKAVSEGSATVTITYDNSVGADAVVTIYVVVEGATTTSSVSGIEVSVDGDQTDDFDYTGVNALTVPLFSLKDVFGGSFDDGDVLQKTPTAMHALLYALELNHDPDVGDPWDWDWVASNVDINVLYQNQGGFVEGIEDDDNTWTDGWQYKIDSVDPGHAASVEPLEDNNDPVDWGFWAY